MQLPLRLIPIFFIMLSGLRAQDGQQLYTLSCSACHGADGLGAGAGAFPPLAGSPWVLGEPDRAIKIALHGLTGPIDVGGKTYNLEMPPQGAALSDEHLAAILSYVRSAWGNQAAPVTPAAIAAVRAANIGRKTPWTGPEILALHPLPLEKTALRDLISRAYLGEISEAMDFEARSPKNAEEEHDGIITLADAPPETTYAMRWDGLFDAPTTGEYEFVLDADDTAHLKIAGQSVAHVVGLGACDGSRTIVGKITLAAGPQPFRLEYVQMAGNQGLILCWRAPGEKNWRWLSEQRVTVNATGKIQAWPEIPITPRSHLAMIYRHYIAGTTPRSIGVGFHGGVNLAYSAEHHAPELIWLGKFMDGGRHWTDRGMGAENPAGEKVIKLTAVDVLTEEARFGGYSLDPDGSIHFTTHLGQRTLHDHWQPIAAAGFSRRVELKGSGPAIELLVTDAPAAADAITLSAIGGSIESRDGKSYLKLQPAVPVTLDYRWK